MSDPRKRRQRRERRAAESERMAEIEKKYEQDATLPVRIVLDPAKHFERNALGTPWIYWAIKKNKSAALIYMMKPELRQYGEVQGAGNYDALNILVKLIEDWPELGIKALEEQFDLYASNYRGQVPLIRELFEASDEACRYVFESRLDLWELPLNTNSTVIAFIMSRHRWAREQAFEHTELLSELASWQYSRESVLEEIVDYESVAEEAMRTPCQGIIKQRSERYLIEQMLKKHEFVRELVFDDLVFAVHPTGNGEETLAHVAVRNIKREGRQVIQKDGFWDSTNSKGQTVLETLIEKHPDVARDFFQQKPELRRERGENGKTMAERLAKEAPSLENRLHALVINAEEAWQRGKERLRKSRTDKAPKI